MRHYPKIISFCNPVLFFLERIQYFFPQWVFLPNNTLHRICLQSQALAVICIPQSHTGQGQEKGPGAPGSGRRLSRRNTSGQSGGFQGPLGVPHSAQPEPNPLLPTLSIGIYGVGKAALHPPALAVLSHTPDGATQTIAWVGKGIVYDTGGLSIKGKVRCRAGSPEGSGGGEGPSLGPASPLRGVMGWGTARFLGVLGWGGFRESPQGQFPC